ncbi:MAG: DUF4129 domain-containing protein [Bacteroidetes bacterium]|nr:DUF4129 domain-containing protein [Bacteroidota bacterium]
MGRSFNIKYLFCIILLLGVLFVFHGTTIKADNEQETPVFRQFDQQLIDDFLEDDDFKYARAPRKIGLWQVFTAWLDRQLEKINPHWDTSWITTWLLYIIMGFAVIMILKNVFGEGLYAAIYKKSKGKNISYQSLDEDDKSIDWQKLIDDAVSEGRYRVAIRLLYLQTLQLLSDAELIDWHKDKTNAQYLRELKDKQLRDKFQILTLTFDYVWFGNLNVDQSSFSKIQNNFRSFLTSPK